MKMKIINRKKVKQFLFYFNLIFELAHFGFAKTPAVPIPSQPATQQAQSLPQTQSDMGLIPNFRANPPTRENSDELDDSCSHNSH